MKSNNARLDEAEEHCDLDEEYAAHKNASNF